MEKMETGHEHRETNEIRELTQNELAVVAGGASDLGAKFQLQLTEANNIFTRADAPAGSRFDQAIYSAEVDTGRRVSK